MRSWTDRGAGAAELRTWDGIVVFWVVLWLVVGGWAGYQVFQLTGLADSTVSSGRALGTAGEALGSLADVPVIGDRTAELGNEVTQTAEGIVQNGTEAGRSVRMLGVLIGLAIALGPVGPVLLFYLPVRSAHGREVSDVASALRSPDAGPQLRALLAQRAVANLSLRELGTISADPQGDLGAGRHGDLARAELRRLGLDPASAP